MRLLHAEDIEDLAAGATLLGGGGGGDPYIGKLMARRALAAHGPVRMLDLAELPDDALVVALGMVGAPTVGAERPFGEDTFGDALRALERYLGRAADALMTLEIGGYNALAPVAVAAQAGLPLVDADAMGRALPEIQMTSLGLHGLGAAPLAIACDNGTRTVLETADNHWAEHLVRSLVIEMGGAVASASYPASGAELRRAAIAGSVSRAIDIGRTVRGSHSADQPVEAIRRTLGGALLFEGKIVDVQRRSDIGFARGQALVEGIGRFQQRRLAVQFQNEYLIAEVDHTVRASVPDLIGVFDLRTGTTIPVEALRYGFQVAVLGIPAPPIWRTPAGLAIVGPRAFGYDVDYAPCDPGA